MEGQVQVRYTRGGRQLADRSFSLQELEDTLFGEALEKEGVTAGLEDGYELYVREINGNSELSAHDQDLASLETVLRAASEDGEITGKTFVIDCTAEHRGAGRKGAGA